MAEMQRLRVLQSLLRMQTTHSEILCIDSLTELGKSAN